MDTEVIYIKNYDSEDATALFALMEREGDEWKDYWQGYGKTKYQKALSGSITYVLYEKSELCGYARCRDDDGYGVYVYDLLVDKTHRGKEYGRLLLEYVCKQHTHDTVYVMSDVDPYYSKLGYEKEGTIFLVKIRA